MCRVATASQRVGIYLSTYSTHSIMPTSPSPKPPVEEIVPTETTTTTIDPALALPLAGTEPVNLAALRANNPSGSNGKRPAREFPILVTLISSTTV
jgi:hypothetical protein